jgi:RluA family pseudouridine synthase
LPGRTDFRLVPDGDLAAVDFDEFLAEDLGPLSYTRVVAKPAQIELGDGTKVPILYEDSAIMAIDKPAGWMLAPRDWVHTGRNLHLAIESSLQARDFWARSRNLKYLRFIHRLDAETSGVLLLAKSEGAMRAFSELFRLRRLEKIYLAAVSGVPREQAWNCTLPLAEDSQRPGVMRVDPRQGKPAETRFERLQVQAQTALVRALLVTGRTHQIRVHLAAAGCPVINDSLYGRAEDRPLAMARGTGASGAALDLASRQIALRAIELSYRDPFRRRPVTIRAPDAAFLRRYGFQSAGRSSVPREQGS